MKEYFFPAIRLTLLSILVFAGLYPLLILGMAKVTPQKGMGERVSANGKTWYGNIGQKFTDDKYFWSRPSAVDYHAAGSAGSNNCTKIFPGRRPFLSYYCCRFSSWNGTSFQYLISGR